MEASTLLEKVQSEIEVLQGIFSDEGIIEETAEECQHEDGSVKCVFKLMPNTGFDFDKVAVFIRARFIFKDSVNNYFYLFNNTY